MKTFAVLGQVDESTGRRRRLEGWYDHGDNNIYSLI